MKSEEKDEVKEPKKKSVSTKRMVYTELSIAVVTFLIMILFTQSVEDAIGRIFITFIAGFFSFSGLHILMGIIYLFVNKREGAIFLLIGLGILVIGLSVCGSMMA